MKVKELIKSLKKQNPDAVVVWQDHDQGEDEMNDYVGSATASSDNDLIERIGAPVVVLRG